VAGLGAGRGRSGTRRGAAGKEAPASAAGLSAWRGPAKLEAALAPAMAFSRCAARSAPVAWPARCWASRSPATASAREASLRISTTGASDGSLARQA
jgi:hypothetical protein